MLLFEKLCEKCRKIEPVKHINCVDEFFANLQKIQTLLADGDFECIGGSDPAQTINQWPQDGLWYRIKCKSCGAVFTLWYDTFEHKGYFKKGK